MYDIISHTPNSHGVCISFLAAVMDPDKVRDYADQFSLSDRDIMMEEDNQILAKLLKQILSGETAADIDQLLQDIPVQPHVVVPVRTVQEAVAAGDLPLLDVDAANVFSRSECILQEHVCKHDVNTEEFSTGCLQNWQLGSAITMGMSWAYPPRAASSGQQGS